MHILQLHTIQLVKFINSEKASKFCKIVALLLTTVHTIKSKVKISKNFVAFSEYMNFILSTEIKVINSGEQKVFLPLLVHAD